MAEIDKAAGLLRIVRPPRQAHPQHIHRRAKICHRETRSLAHGRVTPVGADDEVGADLDRATRAVGVQPDNAIALEDQIVRVGLHPQIKARVAAPLFPQEIQEIPLRHQRDKLADGR